MADHKMGEVVVPAHRVISEITMEVRLTGMGWAMFRMKCALPLIWLATKVAGVGFEVDIRKVDFNG